MKLSHLQMLTMCECSVVSNVTLLFVTDKQIYPLLIRDRLLSLAPARQTQ
jgi:hypothetical protein